MSEEVMVRLSDEISEELSQFSDERLRSTIVKALEELAESESASEKQAELRQRMGVDSSDESAEAELSGEEELADLRREQLRAFLRQERKDGIEKD